MNTRQIYTRSDLIQFFYKSHNDNQVDPFPLENLDFDKYQCILKKDCQLPINKQQNDPFRYQKDDRINPFRNNQQHKQHKQKRHHQQESQKQKKNKEEVPEWADVKIEDIQRELDSKIMDSTEFLYIDASGKTEGPVPLSQLREWNELGIVEDVTSIKQVNELEFKQLSAVLKILSENKEKNKLLSSNPLLDGAGDLDFGSLESQPLEAEVDPLQQLNQHQPPPYTSKGTQPPRMEPSDQFYGLPPQQYVYQQQRYQQPPPQFHVPPYQQQPGMGSGFQQPYPQQNMMMQQNISHHSHQIAQSAWGQPPSQVSNQSAWGRGQPMPNRAPSQPIFPSAGRGRGSMRMPQLPPQPMPRMTPMQSMQMQQPQHHQQPSQHQPQQQQIQQPQQQQQVQRQQQTSHPFNVPTHFSLQSSVNSQELEKQLLESEAGEPTSMQVRDVVEQQKQVEQVQQQQPAPIQQAPIQQVPIHAEPAPVPQEPPVSLEEIQSQQKKEEKKNKKQEVKKPKKSAWGAVPQQIEVVDMKKIQKQQSRLQHKQQEEELKEYQTRMKQRSWGGVTSHQSKPLSLDEIQKLQKSQQKEKMKTEQPANQFSYSGRVSSGNAWGAKSTSITLGNIQQPPKQPQQKQSQKQQKQSQKQQKQSQKQQKKKSKPKKSAPKKQVSQSVNAWGVAPAKIATPPSPPSLDEPEYVESSGASQSVWSYSAQTTTTKKKEAPAPKKRSKKKKKSKPTTYASISASSGGAPSGKVSNKEEDFPSLGNPLAQNAISKEFRKWYNDECAKMNLKNLANQTMLNFLVNVQNESDLREYIMQYFGVNAYQFANAFISNRSGGFQTQKKKKRGRRKK